MIGQGHGSQVLPVTAVVLTLNEHRNLPECLDALTPFVARVVVVDSFSTDDTEQIARSRGCDFVQHAFRNQADQLKWALDTLPLETDWVMRVDADERWTADGFAALRPLLGVDDVSGVSVHMRIMFMGRWLRHGGLYPNDFLRVFRRSKATVEQRWMDEHVTVAGRTVSPGIDVIESNYDRQRNIGLWTAKHNAYSTREAVDILIARHRLDGTETVANLWGSRTERKRWLKEKLYWRIPGLVRPLLYFLYRYVLAGGFLDGRPGLVFHVLQAFWYRFLVDVKVIQLEDLARESGKSIQAVIEDSYGIRL